MFLNLLLPPEILRVISFIGNMTMLNPNVFGKCFALRMTVPYITNKYSVLFLSRFAAFQDHALYTQHTDQSAVSTVVAPADCTNPRHVRHIVYLLPLNHSDIVKHASRSVLLIVCPKCTLAASHAVPWCTACSIKVRRYRQTDGRQTVLHYAYR